MANFKVADAVDLGFIERTPSWKLRSKYFPSKIGGKPSWLSFYNLPSSNELQCQVCGNILTFLLQVYAPIDNNEEAFHRTIFIFICTSGKCFKKQSNSNLVVFRSQLSRKNAFYDFNPPIEAENGSEIPSAQQFQELCDICGFKAILKCEICLKRHYCSKDHLTYDWEKEHKIMCCKEVDNKKKLKKKKSPLLPEYELVIEMEYLPEKVKEKSDEEKMKEYETFLNSSKIDNTKSQLTDDALEDFIKKPDKIFNKFQKRIALEPEQVLRYQRGGVPLWVSSENIPSNEDIPTCECGSKRIFEFQILPQLLNHLSLDTVQDSLDWGTLLVYSCSKSCCIEDRYTKEFMWKQDFSDDN